VLPVAKRSGIPTTYIESVSRVNGPSLSGRMLGALRAADLYTQHRHWAGGRWRFYDGLLTSFAAVHRPVREHPKIFVTLGTIEGYRFDSLIDSLLRTGLVDDRTYWQLGYTDRTDLPGVVHRQVSSERFATAARDADVVVTHGGVGTIFQLLEMGVFPIVVPRDKVRNEHVDNHQYQIATLVDELGIGMMREPSTLTAESVLAASGMSIVAAAHDGSRSR
jgi:UDP-N-acetylglucosamine transferase subunit ALG13